jgi:Peptidase A4 family
MPRSLLTSIVALSLAGAAMLATGPASASTPAAGPGLAGVLPGGTAGSLTRQSDSRGARAATNTHWSGYVVSGSPGTYKNVSASWTQPAAKCSPSGQQDAAFWVGLDGYTSKTVEQLGTDDQCSKGSVTYYAWVEMFPNPTQVIPHTVRPGDKMSASVTESGKGKFTLKISDVTQHWTSTTNKTLVSAKLSSAEVIIEAPANSRLQIYPLANFGSVSFTGSTVNGSAIGTFNPTRITMADGSKKLDSITGLTQQASFSSTWLAAGGTAGRGSH